MKKYIITGAPHSGKSKVIKQLEKKGINVMHETARLIIQEDQEKKNVDQSFIQLYPWDDQLIFCRRCHERQVEREKQLTESSDDIIVLDRSIIDNLAYAAVEKINLGHKIYDDIAAAGYEKKVFFFDLLKTYKTDEQRKDSEEQVKAVHKELYKAYSGLGFEMITIPVYSNDKNTNIMKRAEAVLRHIQNNG